MDVITPRQLAALRDQGYLVVPADCVPASLMHRALDPATVPVAQPRVMVRHVIQAAAMVSGFPADLLMGHWRRPELVLPRHCAMYVAVREFGHSLMTTARVFGDRDHSTVGYAVRRVDNLLYDPASHRGTRISLELIATEARHMAADTQVAA